MKKISLLIIGLFALLLPLTAYASSANISVSASNVVQVGNTVTVTVNITSGSNIGSWQADLSYDKSYLQLTSSTAEAGGSNMANTVANGTKSKSYTFKFKALKSGSTNVSVSSYALYDYDTMAQMSVSAGSKTITLKTKEEIEASYSTNANLKSLKVGEYQLSPEFKKDVFEYNVEVENEIESVNISASKEDGTATVTGAGDVNLVEGNNKFEIKVTAQKGNVNTYIVNINRKELDPINVSVKGNDFTLVRRKDQLGEFTGYTESIVTVENEEIPALSSEITGLTIVGVKDNDGNISYYTYENGKFLNEYKELKSNSLVLFPLELEKDNTFKNYKIKDIDFNGEKVQGYVLDNDKRAIIYAMNVETGVTGYYIYDSATSSVITYSSDEKDYYEKQITNLKYVLYGFIGLSVILFIIIIFRKPKKEKNKTILDDNYNIENNIEEIKEEPKIVEDNEIIKDEGVKEGFIEPIDSKKKKNKKKKN